MRFFISASVCDRSLYSHVSAFSPLNFSRIGREGRGDKGERSGKNMSGTRVSRNLVRSADISRAKGFPEFSVFLRAPPSSSLDIALHVQGTGKGKRGKGEENVCPSEAIPRRPGVSPREIILLCRSVINFFLLREGTRARIAHTHPQPFPKTHLFWG